MKKKLLVVFCLHILVMCFGQNLKPLPQKITDAHKMGARFTTADIFGISDDNDLQKSFQSIAGNSTLLTLKANNLRKITEEKPEYLSLNIPFEGKTITVELYKNNIFADGFKVQTGKNVEVSYKPGIYYQGIVKDDPNSVVAFSFFTNDIIGIASTQTDGNIVVGKLKDNSHFISYSDTKLTMPNNFVCKADEVAENIDQLPDFAKNIVQKKVLTDNCARAYYELANSVYVNKNSNLTETINWMTGLHNNIAAIYTNDNIKIAVSEIYVWTTPDPYATATGSKLDLFKDTRTTYNGDLANFVDAPSSGGSAYTNSLCTNRSYSFTGTGTTYQTVPVYSFSVFSLAHEIGHILGSPHTHACVWNGNDTAIDGCGTQAGYSGCVGPIPTGTGGTIMSYCHLVSGAGINLSNGFGPQPANLIRNTVESKSCLGTNCTTSCAKTITAISSSAITQVSATVSWTDATANAWRYKVEKLGGSPQIIFANTVTSTPSINLTNLLPGTYYKVSVATDCNGSQAFQTSKVFMTDSDFCNNFIWTDTGGQSLDYDNNEDFTITFRPSTPGQKVRINFAEFDIQPTFDALWIYNGPSTTSAVFSNANYLSGNTNPGIFTSTHSTGALTVKFYSSGGTVGPGWKATVSCLGNLNISEVDSQQGINVYPNPASRLLNIVSDKTINSYKIFDEAGRIFLNKEKINSKSFVIDLSDLLTGNYIISLKAEGVSVNRKFIKK